MIRVVHQSSERRGERPLRILLMEEYFSIAVVGVRVQMIRDEKVEAQMYGKRK